MPINSETPELNPTDKELAVIRKELEHLQKKSLRNIWEQIKELNEQNALLVQEVTLLRKGLSDQVAKGVVIGSIFLAIVMGVLTMCASL